MPIVHPTWYGPVFLPPLRQRPCRPLPHSAQLGAARTAAPMGLTKTRSQGVRQRKHTEATGAEGEACEAQRQSKREHRREYIQRYRELCDSA